MDMRQDYPRMTACYVVDNKVNRSTRGGDRVLQWARHVVKNMDKAVRRIARLYYFYLDDDEKEKFQKNAIMQIKIRPYQNHIHVL